MGRARGTNSEATWEALHDAAREVLGRDGIEGFSLRRVASLAGFRLATLQHYFRTKAELIEVVLSEPYRRQAALIDRSVRDLESGAPLVEVGPRLTVEVYRLVREHRHFCRARMNSNLVAGTMSEESSGALEAAVVHIASASGLQQLDRLRLGLHSLSVLAIRYGAHEPDELVRLTGADGEAEAIEVVEEHLRQLATALARRLR
ncbi:MAG: TetR family transcriptional regulator [Nannocystaceae bacterium]